MAEILFKLSVVLILSIQLIWPQFCVQSFTFEDLKNINGSCYNRGTCHGGRGNRLDLSLDWKEVNCFCDDACIEYGDCCLLAKAYNSSEMARAVNKYECLNVYPLGSYYMQGSCKKGWANEHVLDLCLQAEPGSSSGVFQKDPFLHTPVTSISSDITYKNFYCAVCNDESLQDLQPWNAQLSCPDLINVNESELRENVQFIDNAWGFYVNSSAGRVFHSCDIFPVVTETVIHKVRRCEDYVATCASNWTDSVIESLCHSYTTIVYGPSPRVTSDGDDNHLAGYSVLYSRAFRNYHCALCNFIDVTNLHCYERDFRTADPISPVSLSVLFDFGKTKSPCSLGKIWDPFSRECRQVVCYGKNYEYRYGRCVKVSENIGTDDQETENTNFTDSGERNGTKCDKMFFNNTDFTNKSDETVIIHSIRRTYKRDEYEIYKDGILVCIPASYSRLMGWLTLFGLGLSCFCLVLHLIAFCIVPDLRNLSGKNLASLCGALLIAYICFLITTFKESGTDSCQILASFMYYFFLASFLWMNVMAFDIWRTLQRATSELRVSAGKQWSKFISYSLYSWTIPAVALVVVLTINYRKPSQVPLAYLPEFGDKFCWFGQRNAILVYFAAPLSAIMSANMLFFAFAVRMVALSAQSSRNMSTAQPHQLQLKLYLRLALLMGLSWISGIVAGFFQQEYLWYLFILLNAFQGLYILIAFTCTKKVRRALTDPKTKLFRVSIRNILHHESSSSRAVLAGQDSNTSQMSHTSATTLSCTTSKASLPSP